MLTLTLSICNQKWRYENELLYLRRKKIQSGGNFLRFRYALCSFIIGTQSRCGFSTRTIRHFIKREDMKYVFPMYILPCRTWNVRFWFLGIQFLFVERQILKAWAQHSVCLTFSLWSLALNSRRSGRCGFPSILISFSRGIIRFPFFLFLIK